MLRLWKRRRNNSYNKNKIDPLLNSKRANGYFARNGTHVSPLKQLRPRHAIICRNEIFGKLCWNYHSAECGSPPTSVWILVTPFKVFTIFCKFFFPKELSTVKRCFWEYFLKCAIPGHFSFIFVFSLQLTVNKCSIKFSDDWIQTVDLWYRKQPSYQLSHNHCTFEGIFGNYCFLIKTHRVLYIGTWLPPPSTLDFSGK